jgi:hypothetical protein
VSRAGTTEWSAVGLAGCLHDGIGGGVVGVTAGAVLAAGEGLGTAVVAAATVDEAGGAALWTPALHAVWREVTPPAAPAPGPR